MVTADYRPDILGGDLMVNVCANCARCRLDENGSHVCIRGANEYQQLDIVTGICHIGYNGFKSCRQERESYAFDACGPTGKYFKKVT